MINMTGVAGFFQHRYNMDKVKKKKQKNPAINSLGKGLPNRSGVAGVMNAVQRKVKKLKKK